MSKAMKRRRFIRISITLLGLFIVLLFKVPQLIFRKLLFRSDKVVATLVPSSFSSDVVAGFVRELRAPKLESVLENEPEEVRELIVEIPQTSTFELNQWIISGKEAELWSRLVKVESN